MTEVRTPHTTSHDDSLFAYVRVSTKAQQVDSQVSEISDMFPQAQLHIERGVSGKIPAKDRPELSRLLDKLRRGDTLIVWWVDRLGRDYQDVESVMRELLHQGITIKTVNQKLTFAYTGDDMKDMTTNIQVTMLTAMAAAERKNRLASAEAGRQALRQRPEEWAKKFQGRKPNAELHQRILELLGEPEASVRKVAATLGCNPSTVQRVKKMYSNLSSDIES